MLIYYFYFIIMSLFMALLLKIICCVKQKVVDTGEGCTSDGKMPHVVEKRAANRSMCNMILNTCVVICT
jgi:hypothetical protein